MPILPRIAAYTEELVATRRDIHAHPEIGFEEERTSELVTNKLSSWGIEVHRGIGRTGVVGVLKGEPGSRRIALRADMDALPMQEETGLPFCSKNPGRFHGCGHDGHTTMLLGAARYLAETRGFEGTAVFVFQPAEEGLGGARAMIADGLFEHFACDEIYALHNTPDLPQGSVVVGPGPAMAGADFFDVTITGRGSHGAMPHQSVDPLVVVNAFFQAAQTIVSRNVDPLKAAVLSITRMGGGSAYNVIPGEAHLGGTIRAFDDEVRSLVRERLRALGAGLAASFNARIQIDIRDIFTVLVNHDEQARAMAEIAGEIVGAENVSSAPYPMMGSEDFADMLEVVPGAYAWIGMADGPALHHPKFSFDDLILPVGSSLLARLVERRTSI
jgi:amidohydrolase